MSDADLSGNTATGTHTAFIGGATLAWREAGTGAALVLLHGIGSAAASWKAQIDAFADNYRVIAWDAPGYGGSDALGKEAPGATDYAERLAALLDHLEVKSPVIVGHSLGALMLTAFLQEHEAAAAVFADPATGYGRADAATREDKLASRIALFESLGPAGLAESRGPGLLSSTAPAEAIATVCRIMAGVRADGYLPAARMLAGGDLLANASTLELPALVLCGEHDDITPPVGAKQLAAAIPGALYREVPAAGHASYVERPREFNALLSEFLRTLSGGDKKEN